MNRQDPQHLADLRTEEARVILDNGYYSDAYYPQGYAVECGLMAYIAKQTQEFDFPEFLRLRDSYSHDFKTLPDTAGLYSDVQREIGSNAVFPANWGLIVGDRGWIDDSRYHHSISRDCALQLFPAVTSEDAGVLPRLKRQW